MPAGRDTLQRERDLAFVRKCDDARARGLTWNQLANELGLAAVAMLLDRRRKVEKRLGIVIPSMSHGSRDKTDPDRAGAVVNAAKFKANQPTSDLPSFEELLEHRRKQTRRKLNAKASAELVEVALEVSGPFGLAMIGDPHIDSPGCNLDLLMEHTQVIAGCERMYALCVGDIQDNWIGRLSRLWSGQGVSASESQVLAEGWLRLLGPKLVAMSYGNHDCWLTGMSGAHPLDWIRTRFGTVSQAHGVRLAIGNKEGQALTVNLRHDFPGRSQYNPAHGPMKSMLFGFRDDVAVAGHTHEFGMLRVLDAATRKPMSAVRLGSYKHSDEYADEKGFLDRNLTECAVLIYDPLAADRRHRTFVIESPRRAAQVLEMLGAEWDARPQPQKKARRR